MLIALLTFALSACRTGIKPHTPRVARGAGYELALERAFNAQLFSEPSRGAQHVLVAVKALPPGARLRSYGVVERQRPLCAESEPEGDALIQEDAPASLLPATRVGERLALTVSQRDWEFALQHATRLELRLTLPDGAALCAAMPLTSSEANERWDAVGSWTLESVINFEFFMRHVEGLYQLGMFGLEFGKWLGPLRVHLGSGAGASRCSREDCPAMKGRTDDGNPNEKYYVPLLAGVGGTMLQLGPVAFEGKLQYRVAWTAAETFDGLSRVFLHGPVGTASIVYTARKALGLGVPGGTRRGLGIGAQLPLAYVFSARGESTFSVGANVMVMFPIH